VYVTLSVGFVPAGIPGSVEFVEGQGGLPTVMLKHACGSSAQVNSSSSSSSSTSNSNEVQHTHSTCQHSSAAVVQQQLQYSR
jgi:hypothetical protein